MIKRIIKNIACFGLQTSNIESQSGFTLVELLVAMTIGAALSIGLVMTVRTVFSTNSSVVNRVTAINQVQNAVDYISRDSQTAQAQNGSYVSSTDSNSNAILTFTIPQLPNGEAAPASIIYTVNNDTLTRNGQLIATNIPSGGFTVDVSGVRYVSITSTVTGYRSATETRIINLEP